MRRGVNKDLGYSAEERSENLRRSGHIAKLFNEHGLICLAAFVAPSQAIRDRVANVIGKDRFLVVHCTAAESVLAERRNAATADGNTSPERSAGMAYETPDAAELTLDTGKQSIAECTDAVVNLLKAKGIIR